MTSPSKPPALEDILFLDIETVSQTETLNELDNEWQQLWLEKSKYNRERKQQTIEASYEEAGIYAEFGKIICISAGYFEHEDNSQVFKVTSFFGNDEYHLLESFIQFLETGWRRLCAHNGKEFDFPYLCRRMLVNGFELPSNLDLAGKKPWENPHIDTMEMWKFGDYKHYSSVRLLAKLFDIPTPKDDIDGSQVRDVFYLDNDIDRIERYCKKDVVTVARLYLRLCSMESFADRAIQWLPMSRYDIAHQDA
jgi:3'-5' exonuclease